MPKTMLKSLPGLALAAMQAAAQIPASLQPELLALPPDTYPESVAAAPDGSLYVGSWRNGSVLRIAPGARAEVLVKPGANGLDRTQGLLVDAARGHLWVCSASLGSNPAPQAPSALKRYALSTGEPNGSYAMPDGNGYCNDLALAEDGSVFVTDSLQARLLRLAPGRDALETWVVHPELQGSGPFPGLNGIAIDGDAVYVSLVQAAAGAVFRIERLVQGQAGRVTRLMAPRVLKNVDAIRRIGPGQLMLFESNAFGADAFGGQIVLATAQPGSNTLQLQPPIVGGLSNPSSGAVLGSRVYFIESKFGLLLRPRERDDPLPLRVPFVLQSVPLP